MPGIFGYFNKNNSQEVDPRSLITLLSYEKGFKGDWIRNDSKSIINNTLKKDTKISQYIKQEKINDLIEKHMNNEKDNNTLILDLLNLEILLNLYEN